MKELGVDEVFIDKLSGKNTDRPQLKKMLSYVRKGDTVIVSEISRFARNTKDLLDIVENLNNKGVHLISNKENLDTSTATGKLMLTVIGAIAEFERQQLLERQREGIAIAKIEGKFKGKQVKAIDEELFARHYAEYKLRKINKVQLAEKLNISRPTLDKLLKEKGL